VNEINFTALVVEYNRRIEKGYSKGYCQRMWKQIIENYDTNAEWARHFTIRHKDKTITITKGERGRPNYTKQHIIWNVPDVGEGSVVYLLHIFFEDTKEFWASKVGTAENAQRRFQEEIKQYSTMTGRPIQIRVQMCEPCHSMKASIACESRMRNWYIRKYEDAFVPNDRFEGIVIDPKHAKKIAHTW
jgi:hypothetical protein